MSPTESVVASLRFLLKIIFLNPNRPDSLEGYLSLIFISPLIYTDFKAIHLMTTKIRNISQLVEALIPMIPVVLATVKLISLAVNRKTLDTLFDNVTVNLIRGITVSQSGRFETAGYLSNLLVRGLLGGLIAFEVSYTASNVFFSGEEIDLPWPMMKSLIPGDGIAFFAANFILQLSMMYSVLLSTVVSDGALVTALLHLDASLDVFADKLDNFEVGESVTEQLYEIWQYQLIIIGFKGTTENVFRHHISVQFVASMGVLCVCLCGLTGDTAVALGILVVLALIEIFSVCFIGERIRNKSDAIGTRLYFLPWPELARPHAHSLLIMMAASQRPLTLCTLFADLTLETFGQVLKTTYSLFTILHNAD